MAFVKKYYGPILLLVVILIYGGFKIYQNFQFNALALNPEVGDIYIFEGDDKYSPYLLDRVAQDSLYFFSHSFDYSENMPSSSQIMEDSFHNNIYYIYGQSEVNRLIEENKIIKIYR